MSYSLGQTSKKNLVGVIPQLVKTVELAITLTRQDFVVYEGLRTLARQRLLVKQGYSRTLDSYHLPQADKFGHAVDLVPWIQGHPVWDWEGCYEIALAMDSAATQLGSVDMIVWGAVWDKSLAAYGGDKTAYKKAVQEYQARHAGKDFLDGPHFQWKR